MDSQELGEDGTDGHPRVERRVRILEHHLYGPPVFFSSLAAEVVAVETNRPGCRLQLPGQAPGDGGLAAPGLADETEHLAFGHPQAHPVHGAERAPVLGAERHREVVDLDERLSHAVRLTGQPPADQSAGRPPGAPARRARGGRLS